MMILSAVSTGAAQYGAFPMMLTDEQIKKVDEVLTKERFLSPETGLEEALRNYQRKNGLETTGARDFHTIEKMKIPMDEGQLQSRPVIFPATKDQLVKAQKILKQEDSSPWKPSGEMDAGTYLRLQNYQVMNGLNISGRLDPKTMEKMKISLTDDQKKWIEQRTAAAAAKEASFRPSTEQITKAQMALKRLGLYYNQPNGSIDDATTEAVKNFQTMRGIKVTEKLDRATLRLLGIDSGN